jgi:hypothetical protein
MLADVIASLLAYPICSYCRTSLIWSGTASWAGWLSSGLLHIGNACICSQPCCYRFVCCCMYVVPHSEPAPLVVGSLQVLARQAGFCVCSRWLKPNQTKTDVCTPAGFYGNPMALVVLAQCVLVVFDLVYTTIKQATGQSFLRQ